MKEIGGYIELDTYSLPMLHAGALALNCGRCALSWLIRARGIKRLLIPKFICDAVTGACERVGLPYMLYCIGSDFLPADELRLGEGEWLYLVNYYSQLTNEQIEEFRRKYGRIIVDNAQSYFQLPAVDTDTLYTCRKYFGVADGAFLYTDVALDEELPLDESHARMGFLLGRYERPASEYYAEYDANNRLFDNEPVKRMSRLTENLLHGIDYAAHERRRRENFEYLHTRLAPLNGLCLRETGTFMYPFLTENGAALRRRLQAEKIYIPTLWPNVFTLCGEDEYEYRLAENILPLPIDQRYGPEDMQYMLDKLLSLL